MPYYKIRRINKMARKNDKDVLDLKGVDIIELVQNNTNKKGKIVGSKKQVKALKNCCAHHLRGRKGKLKPRTQLVNDKLICRTCKSHIRTQYYSDNEVDKRADGYKEVVSQGQLIAVSIGSGNRVLQNFAETKMHIDKATSDYKKVRNIAEKSEKAKKGKKKNGRNKSNSFTGWQPSRR